MNAENIKTDRRINRTRRQLRDALMALILERGYSSVTIEDITERADLGRTTFYLHFRDKDELLVESLEAIAEDLKAQVEQLADQSLEEGRSRPHPVVVAFRHAERNRNLYRIILKGEGGSRVASRIRDIIQEAAVDFFARRMSGWVDGSPDIPGDVVSGYFASALLGFITWWLEKELPYSGDEAADLFITLFFRGARQVLHLTVEV
jgi:AcrR family transcriptional regulator